MYTVIHRTVSSTVEFIHGIPSDLEDDDFFDPRINNLLILDDLFSEAVKDKRIRDSFTEETHHRSLSVISISQNLFASQDPTQGRYCHYLVLFNKPVDKQSVMTLARQMYPGKSEKMMKMFDKATRQPYGYLLVDLKAYTPENDRLKCNITWADQHLETERPTYSQSDLSVVPIKEDSQPEVSHSSTGFQPVHIEEKQEIMAEKVKLATIVVCYSTPFMTYKDTSNEAGVLKLHSPRKGKSKKKRSKRMNLWKTMAPITICGSWPKKKSKIDMTSCTTDICRTERMRMMLLTWPESV